MFKYIFFKCEARFWVEAKKIGKIKKSRSAASAEVNSTWYVTGSSACSRLVKDRCQIWVKGLLRSGVFVGRPMLRVDNSSVAQIHTR